MNSYYDTSSKLHCLEATQHVFHGSLPSLHCKKVVSKKQQVEKDTPFLQPRNCEKLPAPSYQAINMLNQIKRSLQDVEPATPPAKRLRTRTCPSLTNFRRAGDRYDTIPLLERLPFDGTFQLETIFERIGAGTQ